MRLLRCNYIICGITTVQDFRVKCDSLADGFGERKNEFPLLEILLERLFGRIKLLLFQPKFSNKYFVSMLCRINNRTVEFEYKVLSPDIILFKVSYSL